ncbi:selenium-dependent xanthine dehydrogenase [Deltaproteobacteria bacterium Smac51]|nr:selenium-dependent xanthine dehydrogenase [Deltaproteobacteria bacterium Smac51]
MPVFTLNGQEVVTPGGLNLLEYLREEARLTSVKNGCAEGACGACMVVVDGKATRACLLKTDKLEGKNVITVEGLPEREKKIFAHAFGSVGAVQCGFCIPGMVMSAKALLDKNSSPSAAEIKDALKFNICRCTGYVKIEKAIALAAEFWREPEKELPDDHHLAGVLGDPIHRVDAAAKTLGLGLYTDDLKPEGLLYGRALRPAAARILVKSIDVSEALKVPGVMTIMLAEDIPGSRFLGHLPHTHDWPALIAAGEETRYIGDALALVAAVSWEAVDEALKKIVVDYDELPPMTSPEMAMAEGAPKIHPKGNILQVEKLYRGTPEESIAKSKYVVTNTYDLPFTEHAFLEPECAIGMPDGDGVMLFTGGQSIYDEQRECALVLGLPPEKVRVRSMLVGGGFGGKEDMSVQHHAALLAWKTQAPVKVRLSRQESINVHPKRHAMKVEMTTACDENGLLTAMRCRILSDTGAYASLGGPVLQRACTHAAGPYNYQNVDIIGTAVYTNNPPAGAFRGFGVTQTVHATECNLNQLAKMAGISDWEIRFRNALKPGDVMPNGQIADESTALLETLMSVKEEYEKAPLAGIGCALKNSGVGVGLPDTGRCRLVVSGGKVHIYTSAACIGQGMATVNTQMVATFAGIDHGFIVAEPPDTANSPDSGTTTASRQTVFTGEATRRAALKLKEAMKNKSLTELDGHQFNAEYLGETDPMGSPKANPVSHVAYGYATHLVLMDPDSGLIEKIIAVHDVGRVVNPQALEGQIEGGVVTSLGYGLTEDFPLKDGIPQARFGTLGLFKAAAVPPIEPRYLGREACDLAGGAKGVGEIAAIPTSPAIQGAYYKRDGIFRTKLPMEDTPYSRRKKTS